MFVPASGRVKVARLHPLLLLKCAVVGDRVLASTTQHVVAGFESPRDVGYVDRMHSNLSDSTRSVDVGAASLKQSVTTVPLREYPLGLRANGFEELLLLEVRHSVTGWELGPMEKGLFEREIDAENGRKGLPHGVLRTRLTRVRTLPQLCQRVALVETRPGRARPLNRGASRLDSLRPVRLYSAKSKTSEVAAEDSFGSVGDTSIVSSSMTSGRRPAGVPMVPFNKSNSRSYSMSQQSQGEGTTSDRSQLKSLQRLQSTSVHFSPRESTRSDGEESDCDGSATERRARKEPRRELTFNLANTILTAYDIPGILHVMEWHGKQARRHPVMDHRWARHCYFLFRCFQPCGVSQPRLVYSGCHLVNSALPANGASYDRAQIFKSALAGVNVLGKKREGKVQEVLADERKIAARLIDTSWPVRALLFLSSCVIYQPPRTILHASLELMSHHIVLHCTCCPGKFLGMPTSLPCHAWEFIWCVVSV
jgi:hypothetical protein